MGRAGGLWRRRSRPGLVYTAKFAKQGQAWAFGDFRRWTQVFEGFFAPDGGPKGVPLYVDRHAPRFRLLLDT